jgi:pyridinium-3,5-bisthiocarboxylic acid mononucleotide nickel chelatase
MIIEANIDDSSPELLGTDFQEELMKSGGIDYYFTSIQMKKGRPGQKLSVLVALENLEQVSTFILEHSTSIGLRYYPVNRTILERNHFEMDTPYGKVRIKEVTTPSGAKRHKIEYESLKKLKESHNISILRLEEELYPLLSKLQHHEKK